MTRAVAMTAPILKSTMPDVMRFRRSRGPMLGLSVPRSIFDTVDHVGGVVHNYHWRPGLLKGSEWIGGSS
jgi:hypothetical protein